MRKILKVAGITIALTTVAAVIRANIRVDLAYKNLNSKPGLGAIDLLHERINNLEK